MYQLPDLIDRQTITLTKTLGRMKREMRHEEPSLGAPALATTWR